MFFRNLFQSKSTFNFLPIQIPTKLIIWELFLSKLQKSLPSYQVTKRSKNVQFRDYKTQDQKLQNLGIKTNTTKNWPRDLHPCCLILLLPRSAALPESDAGSDVIKPASSFVIRNHQTSCSMWCSMYRARC